MNISNLADGVYSITGNMVKVDKTTASMSDAAIDHTIKLDVSKLPKLMQNTIADLEEYEKKGEWVMYDGLADGLESFAKSALLQNVISEAQFNQILKKYRGGL